MGQTPWKGPLKSSLWDYPSSFASLDLDQQLRELRSRANYHYFGNRRNRTILDAEAPEDLRDSS